MWRCSHGLQTQSGLECWGVGVGFSASQADSHTEKKALGL